MKRLKNAIRISKRARCSFHWENNGFSTIEVITAIAVLSLVAVAVLGVSVQIMQTYSVIKAALFESQEAALIDTTLRNHINSIRFPYWLSELPIPVDSDNRLVLKYVDGNKNKAFQLEYSDSILRVSTGDWEDESFQETESRRFTGITKFSWEILSDEFRGEHGIIVRLEKSEFEEPIICKEEFSGFILKGKEF